MRNIVWRKNVLGDLFEFSSGNTFALKDFNVLSEYQENTVEIVTSSKDNKNSYLQKTDLPANYPIYNKSLTINRNGSIGYCFYHEHDFIIPTGDSYALIHKNETLKKILDQNCYHFLSLIITHIFTTSVYGYSYKVNVDRFDREIILLPCIEVTKEEYIWEENGHYYTLAVDYIKKLMKQAKELREKKTIRLYEAGYKQERDVLVWKKFILGELFDRNSSHAIKAQKKELDEATEYDESHPIRNITASKNNCGCSGFLADEGEVKLRKKKNLLTIASDAAYGGVCFYQTEEFVSTGHNNILEIKNEKLKSCLDNNINLYYFLAKMITKLLHNDVINRFSRPIGADFDREIILLPCIEVTKEEYIWEENGHYYTLAVDYISYIYLSGRVKFNQKLIDNYTYQY